MLFGEYNIKQKKVYLLLDEPFSSLIFDVINFLIGHFITISLSPFELTILVGSNPIFLYKFSALIFSLFTFRFFLVFDKFHLEYVSLSQLCKEKQGERLCLPWAERKRGKVFLSYPICLPSPRRWGLNLVVATGVKIKELQGKVKAQRKCWDAGVVPTSLPARTVSMSVLLWG